MPRRGVRDWLVDSGLFLFAAVFGVMTAAERLDLPALGVPLWAFYLDQVADAQQRTREAIAREIHDVLGRRLSDREREVAIAVGQGMSNAEIGARLYLSLPTVKAHVSHVLTKFQLNNRVQIALLVHDAGLLDGPPDSI